MTLKKQVLILGVTGMLGHTVHRVLSASHNIVAHGTHISDKRAPFYFDALAGLRELEEICDRSPCYDYFINCIGILPGNIAETEPTSVRKAIKINALFPHELSAFAKERKARIIHISTDGVFAGEAESHFEDSPCDCRDFYGITKSLGEVSDTHFLNLRCSIIGPSPFLGGGLLEWFLKQPAGSVVQGYTNHIWHGISTYQFGELCLKIIEGDHFEELRSESAVFHFAPNEPITKYELLSFFREMFKKNVFIKAVASDNKMYKRILHTKYCGLKKIYPFGIPAARMISELACHMNEGKREIISCK